MSEQDKKKREQVAEQINAFLRTVGAPVMVQPEEIAFTDTGVRVTKQLLDVHFTVDVGQQSLGHLAMAHGLFSMFGPRRT